MPKVRLTTSNVMTLQAKQGKATDYTDAGCPGFVLRVMPSGVRSYGVRVRHQGRPRRWTLGPVEAKKLATAREEARAIMRSLDRGEEPAPVTVPGALTVGGLVRRMLAAVELRPKTRDEWDRLARTDLASLADVPAASLTRAEVRSLLREVKVRSGWVANHCLAILRRAYSWALAEDLLESNPCSGIPLPHRGRSSDRVLTADELRALLRAIERGRRHYPEYADATALLLYTGVRLSCVTGMRREELSDLDGREPRWTIPAARMKNDSDHVVPLPAAAVAIVKRRLALTHGSSWLFPAHHGGKVLPRPMGWAGRWRSWLRRRVARAVQARQRMLGQPRQAPPRWRVHDLRHTMATHMQEDLRVDDRVVSALLAHRPRGVSEADLVYMRGRFLDERRAALVAWSAWLDGLGRAAAPAKVLPMAR